MRLLVAFALTTSLSLLGSAAEARTLDGHAAATSPTRGSGASFGSSRNSYFAWKTAQVMHAFLTFAVKRDTVEAQDGVGLLRARDRLLLFSGHASSPGAGARGAALLGAAVILTAHTPGRARVIIDGPVHFGPALFDGGGMGAGIGGRF